MHFEWLNQKFLKWEKFLYPKKPSAATADEWVDFEIKMKASPSRYFLSTTVPDFIQYKLLFPVTWLNNKWWQFKYRYVKKHQYNIIRTELEPGYYDQDTILLYGMFAVLCSYVEEGREQIEWRAEDPDGQCKGIHQDTAIETLALYKWWKEGYLKRPDAIDASGFTACCDEHRKALKELGQTDVIAFMSTKGMTPAMENRKRKALKKMHKMEEDWDKETDEMIIRLIAIRRGMWV